MTKSARLHACPYLSATILLLAILLAAVQPASAAHAAASSPAEWLDRIDRELERSRHADALRLVERAMQLHPEHPELLYRSARCNAQLGEIERAADDLFSAVQAGFRRFDDMQREPDLRPLHDHDIYLAILEALERLGRKIEQPEERVEEAPSRLDEWRDLFSHDSYRFEIDEKHMLVYANALDDVTHREMRDMLRRQAEHLVERFFDAPLRNHVLVAIPRPEEAERFFGGFTVQEVGGSYDHNRRKLIARNIGGSLRHELFHVYHHNHMELLGQRHPLWIQEGLACLYEDYTLYANGRIRYLPNERMNVIKRQLSAGRVMPWSVLFEIRRERFMSNALVLYPQAWSIFRFVAAQGKLEEWYRTYVETYDEDPTSRLAFEKVFDMPLDEIERRWLRWLDNQPMHENVVREGGASLGIIIDDTRRVDGVVIREVLRGGAAFYAGMRSGDEIVAIDGRPVRNSMEVLSIIGPKRVGEVVELRVRREGRYANLDVELRARQ